MSFSKIAFVFPGQGSQCVGMGRDLYENIPESKQVLDQADQALGFSLTDLCFNGPEESLKQTANTQPALLAVSIAVYAAAKDRLPKPVLVAGHSLGEYSALVASGALSLAEGVRLVRARGQAMEMAAASNPGSMAAIIGLDTDKVAEVCAQAGAYVANYNAPGQIVISGSTNAVTKAGELAKAAGAKRALPLKVSGAFHSALMNPAAEQMKKILAETQIQRAEFPVIANVVAEPLTEPADIRDALERQITGSVQWIRSIQRMVAEGVDTIIEMGSGQVLCGMIKRIDSSVKTFSIQDTASLEATLSSLSSAG